MIIGLSGKMGSGKSTIADLLKKYHSKNKAKIFKCAGPLYEIQNHIYDYLGLKLEGEKDRPLLIALGMWGRSKDENIWLNKAIQAAEEYSRNGGLAIIDDVRLENEAKAIESVGLLVRLEGEQRGPNITPESMNSPTETALDKYDFKYVIDNRVSVEQMGDKLNFIIDSYINNY